MQIDKKQLALQIVAVFTIFGLALFFPAGTLAWPAGWIFLGSFMAFALGIFSWLYRHNPELLRERMRLGTADQQSWDKALFPLIQAIMLAWLAFMSLDATRFHWSPLPVWLQGLGMLLLLSSYYLLFRVFRENSFLSPVVRFQDERGQHVISTGPYHYIRHPMYGAMLILVLGTSLLLGSGYGLLVGLIAMALLARRAVLEERMLLKELSGYAEYRARVKYRLIPYLW